MRFLTVLAFIVSLLLGRNAQAQEAELIAKAEVAAQQWLVLNDSGNYATSWEQAAGAFKAVVNKEVWMKAIQDLRGPLGVVKSRKIKFSHFSTSLPGAPEGEYVVIQYETQFSNKENAIETVTPLKDKDGTWRVSGYFIK